MDWATTPTSTLPYTTLFRSRREIKQVCEQDGYQVVEADAGSEALRQIESSRPSVILLEVTLPDAAGIQDRKSTRLNSSHTVISYAVFCLKKKTADNRPQSRP